MENSSRFNFLLLFILILSMPACTPEPVDDCISTIDIEETNPCENQEIVFLDAFPAVEINCDFEDKKFYVNDSGKDQTVTIMGTDNCEDGDSEIELQKEVINDEGETKTVRIKDLQIPDGTSKVITWTIKNGEFLYFYCNGSDENGNCSWTISVK